MSNDAAQAVREALRDRFGEVIDVPAGTSGLDELAHIAGHRTYRRYEDRPVDPSLVRLLCACALSAPSKSDLQQADIVHVVDLDLREAIGDLIPSMPWVRTAPVFLVFCGNGRRLQEAVRMHGTPFPNDHLDAFFNPAVDAAIVLANFLRAATAVGLGCCPISVLRDHAATVSELLQLPDRVFPVAGFCAGWPAEERRIVPRLSLGLTLHTDRYDDAPLAEQITGYDKRRHAVLPMNKQREPERFGTAEFYGWSADKARQYANPQRTDFGAFVRSKGFKLD